MALETKGEEDKGKASGFCGGWAHPAVVRSYLGYYTGSHQNSAVKRPWARIVLGWVTSREVLVLHPPFSFPPLLSPCSCWGECA